jgi:hypothetical protein
LQAAIPPTIKISVAVDRTTTIRASVRDVEISLIISVFLVVLVVFLFLREVWATIIPSVAVPLSLVGTFGVMYLLGYTIDNLSLMALTIATGFVVDDAIVVIENITRYLEDGLKPFDAAMKGSKEIGFTVLSMSASLIAVFIPILLMGGIVGKLFREFAVTLSVAIAVSLLVSLTTTPMLCAQFLKSARRKPPRPIYRASEGVFLWLHYEYNAGLRWVLRHQTLMLCVTIGTALLNIYLFMIVPKGFFPQQDTGGWAAEPWPRRTSVFPPCKPSRSAIGADGRSMIRRSRRLPHLWAARSRRRQQQRGQHVRRLKPLNQRPAASPPIRSSNRLRAASLPAHPARRFSSGPAGHPDRRPRQRGAISVHALRREPERA